MNHNQIFMFGLKLAYIQSGRHVPLNGQVSNPFVRYFCVNLVTTKQYFSPILSPLLLD